MLPYAVARGAASKLDRPAALTMAAAAPASPNGGPPPGLAAARQRLEELFEHWLGLEETEAKINEWVRKAELVVLEQSLLAAGQDQRAEKVQEKLKAIELFGSDYRELPGSALISLQTDRNTSYDLYLQVQAVQK